MTRRGHAVVAGIALAVTSAGVTFGVQPSPTALSGDPRSPGEGPGLVGEPFLAVGAVLAIALLAVLVTVAWVRLTARR